jgi:GGDEF domain-containing protein
MIEQHHLSKRRACRPVGLPRNSYRNPPVLDVALNRASHSGDMLTIMFVDIDNFNGGHDSRGH